MTPVVDIIGTIISGMQYTDAACSVVASPSLTYLVTGLSSTKGLFVGEKLKFTGGSPNGVFDLTVVSINSLTEFTATSTTAVTTGHANNDGTISTTLNYMHMPPLEFERTMGQMAQNPTAKSIRFPLIYLPQGFKESRNTEGYDAICDLVFVLMTDTRSDFSADDRYAYSFTPYLYNLYEKFIETLSDYKGVDLEYDNTDKPRHDKTDNLFWGTDRDLANKISEFVDAIEIAIKIKFLTPC